LPRRDAGVSAFEPSDLSAALKQHIRQQEILAELGVSALHGSSFSQLLDDTVRLTAEGMQSEFCKVMSHIPTERCFLVRAGVGWGPDIVGVATIGDDVASPAGFALGTGQPVISNHLENEEQWRVVATLGRPEPDLRSCVSWPRGWAAEDPRATPALLRAASEGRGFSTLATALPTYALSSLPWTAPAYRRAGIAGGGAVWPGRPQPPKERWT
jgi:hypothetical protein